MSILINSSTSNTFEKEKKSSILFRYSNKIIFTVMNIFVALEMDYLLVIEIQQQVHHLFDDQLHNEQDLYKQLKLSYVHV